MDDVEPVAITLDAIKPKKAAVVNGGAPAAAQTATDELVPKTAEQSPAALPPVNDEPMEEGKSDAALLDAVIMDTS
jgi:hypothetical protein